jgi:hypothetical protein
MHPAQQRYWLRIAAGALITFGIGMTVVVATRHGVGAVKHSVSGALGSIPLAVLPVRVDGRQLGTLRAVEVQPTAQGRGAGIGAGAGAPAVHITVQATDSVLGAQFERCILVPNIGHGNRRFADFKCIAPADTGGAGLRKLGEIVVEPAGATLDIMVPDSQLARWHQVSASDFGDVKSVHIQADSNGAVIDIRDRRGRKLFHLEADSGGARIGVRDDSSARAAKR